MQYKVVILFLKILVNIIINHLKRPGEDTSAAKKIF